MTLMLTRKKLTRRLRVGKQHSLDNYFYTKKAWTIQYCPCFFL
ncbi:hypothetical protein KsCSTR_20770 [Candidatus Kuenenia stuttgartiensis]|uniref:Uncharacterized protein n=1 Tax=Kuenenia stuttgartiensis TaxID=174633 RepID=A0A6G7GPI3_KUEST|nr:hypothetical protein KsCSTR_20770 [Candidatus Kuenenia stuttgartiensis]